MGYIIAKDQKGVPEGKVRYRFDFFNQGKRYRKNVIYQKSVVQRIYREWEQNILSNILGDFSFFEKLDEYLIYAKDVKSAKIYQYEKTIIEELIKKFFHKKMLLKDFNRGHIDDFIRWRRTVVLSKHKLGTVTNATLNRNLSVISYFFNWCIKKEYYNRINPCYLMKLKENNIREVQLTKEQIQELLSKAYEQGERLYTVIVIALYTGMRRGEIFTLQWNEIDFDSCYIRLSQLKTKSKKARLIPIVPSLKEIFLSHRNRNLISEKVITGYTENILKKQWEKFREELSFGRLNDGTFLRFHDLRHIYAQSLLNEGVQLEDIQTLLGHQSIETTQKRYAMFARLDLHQKVEKLEKVIPLKQYIAK